GSDGGDVVRLLRCRRLSSQYPFKSLQYLFVSTNFALRSLFGRVKRVAEQFAHGPGMIGQPSGHGWGAVVIAWRVRLHLLPQRPDAPTKVVPRDHQPRAGLVKAQILREGVRLAFLPPVELPLRPKPSLREAGVDRLGPFRLRQGFLRLLLASHFHHTPRLFFLHDLVVTSSGFFDADA